MATPSAIRLNDCYYKDNIMMIIKRPYPDLGFSIVPIMIDTAAATRSINNVVSDNAWNNNSRNEESFERGKAFSPNLFRLIRTWIGSNPLSILISNCSNIRLTPPYSCRLLRLLSLSWGWLKLDNKSLVISSFILKGPSSESSFTTFSLLASSSKPVGIIN